MDNRHLFKWYYVEGTLTQPLMGGIPANPRITEAWLKVKLADAVKAGQISDSEMATLLCRTLVETKVVESATFVDGKFFNQDGDEIPQAEVQAKIDEAAKRYDKNYNVFKRNSKGLILESRCVKAMIREALSTNKVFVKRRGVKQSFQHLLHVEPWEINLYGMEPGAWRLEPDDVPERPISVQTPQGKMSSIKKAEEIAAGTSFRFFLKNREEDPTTMLFEADLLEALLLAQDQGLGASRSQDHGRWNLQTFQRLATVPTLAMTQPGWTGSATDIEFETADAAKVRRAREEKQKEKSTKKDAEPVSA